MSHYNPYTASFRAVATELTSAKAKQYYSIRAQQDTQMAVDAALSAGIAVYEAAVFTYNLCAFVRAWMHSVEQSAIKSAAIVPVAPAAVELTETPDEIVEEPVIRLLAPAVVPNLGKSVESVVMSAIAETLVIAATQAEAAKYLQSVAPAKAKAKAPAKKWTPKANAKTATPAPRKSPTSVRAGKLVLSID